MLNNLSTGGTPLPLYQLVLLGILLPPVMASILCLVFKIRATGLKTLNSRIVQNTTDWVAFLSFTAAGYVIVIMALVEAHFSSH